tara:strand:+ start:409 stop:558 length:150 start_codon:yes stop_codon:yes gene_type:complete
MPLNKREKKTMDKDKRRYLLPDIEDAVAKHSGKILIFVILVSVVVIYRY